jgi:3-deoxy-7-phosphoheptulonate synthase
MSISASIPKLESRLARHKSIGPSSGPFPTAARLKARFVLAPEAERAIAGFREQSIELVQGHGDRLLAVVGPCSIHDPRAALDYAERLLPVVERHQADLLVVMRVYLEKPRSSVGWKGLISDPRLDGTCDVAHGLSLARELLTDIAARRVPIATELLDINLASYFTDLLTWAAIGARTSESQPHRELASSLPFPVGFKNGTDGRVEGALGGIRSAAEPTRRLAPNDQGRLVLAQSAGNPHCHLTLRGGANGPNYDAASVTAAARLLASAALPSRVLVDCSHGNSGKDHDNQRHVLSSVAAQVAAGARNLLGVMIESHLVAGRQALAGGGAGLRYGQSVTDACVDFAATEQMLEELSQAVRARRAVLASDPAR